MRATSVQGVRAVVFAVVRGLAVMAVLVGVWMIAVVTLQSALSALNNTRFQGGQQIAPILSAPSWLRQVAFSPSLHRGLALILVAVPASLLSGWITRFVFRPPVDACPRCGHGLTVDDAVCSECGQRGLDG